MQLHIHLSLDPSRRADSPSSSHRARGPRNSSRSRPALRTERRRDHPASRGRWSNRTLRAERMRCRVNACMYRLTYAQHRQTYPGCSRSSGRLYSWAVVAGATHGGITTGLVDGQLRQRVEELVALRERERIDIELCEWHWSCIVVVHTSLPPYPLELLAAAAIAGLSLLLGCPLQTGAAGETPLVQPIRHRGKRHVAFSTAALVGGPKVAASVFGNVCGLFRKGPAK